MEIREILFHTPVLLIFVVIGLGYILGQIKIYGFSIGIAGVLFVGLAFGAWQPSGSEPFAIARLVSELGLILFVYAIGLTSGPGFFHSLKERGIRFNIAVLLSLFIGGIIAVVGGYLLDLSPGLVSGVFCGGVTNTPALAAVTQLIPTSENVTEPTLGYSVAYPCAILSFLFAFQWFTVAGRKEFELEKETLRKNIESETRPIIKHFEIRNPKLFGHPIGELRVRDETGIIISRIRHAQNVLIPTKYTLLQEGDVVLGVGVKKNIEKGLEYFGAESQEHIDINSDKIALRRLLVSNKKLVGSKIRDLELERRFNAQITRLRRADIEIAPSHEELIELGDRVSVVMPAEKTAEVSQFFGDSERGIADLDFTAITLGISLGVLVGIIPIPLPGGSSLSLGIAGGPLIVALILGKLGRTGPLVWVIPLEANHTIRHIGLLLFLSSVGITAGSHLEKTIVHSGVQLLFLGILISVATTTAMIVFLRKFTHAGVIATLGASSGMHTQPASLARAYELSQSDEVYTTYAITYPVAMISKIILAQLIWILSSAL